MLRYCPLWKQGLLLLAAALLWTHHLSHISLPQRAPLLTDTMVSGWMGPQGEAKRAYFRQKIHLPFAPQRAWLAISAEDYKLYVNGVLVASNDFVINASNAFQHKMHDVLQGVGAHVAPMIRTPVLKRAQNQEWRMLHYVDISSAVHSGLNQIALFVQSATQPRMAIKGAFSGHYQHRELDGTAATWRMSLTSGQRDGIPWVHPNYPDQDWGFASPAKMPNLAIYSSVAPAIWQQDLPTYGIASPALDHHMRLALTIPQSPKDHTNQTGWLRVHSEWPYTLFANDDIVGTGGASRLIEAFDITRYLGNHKLRLSLHFGSNNKPLPTITIDGRIAEVVVNETSPWEVFSGYHPNWLQGEGDWTPAHFRPVTSSTARIAFQDNMFLDRSFLSRYLLLWLGLTIALALLRILLRKFLSSLAHIGPQYADRATYWVFSIPVMTLASIELLRFRFLENDTILYFLDPNSWPLLYALGPASLLLTLLLVSIPATQKEAHQQSNKPRLQVIFWLVLILILGLALRSYDIGFEDLQADENVSWDAARGIMQTGVPEAVSGVLYTRSPLYHYALAGWLQLWGDSKAVARSFATLHGLVVIIFAFMIALRITGRAYVGLFVAFLLAIDPWQLHVSRVIRFYQQMQMFSVISMYFFLRGFIWNEGRKYQNRFFFFCLMAVFSQEVFVITFPAFCIAAFLYYRPFHWLKDHNIVIGFITVITLTIIDMLVFTLLCLSSHVGIATTSGSIMQLHLLDPILFFNTFFSGNLRVNVLYSTIFFAGILYYLRYHNRAMMTLYLMVLLSIVTATVLVMQLASRYLFGIYPYLVIIAVITLDAILRWVANGLFDQDAQQSLRKRWLSIASVLCALVFFGNLEPHKIWASYRSNINLQHETAYHYIKAHRQPGDKVLTVSPMAGAIVLGGVDYYLTESLGFDEFNATPKGIVDRWGGGILVSKLDLVRQVFERHPRVWIVIDEPEILKFSREILVYLENSSQVEYEFLGGYLRLWDASQNVLPSAQEEGGERDAF